MNFTPPQLNLPPQVLRFLFPKSLPWRIAHAASPIREIMITPFKIVSAYVQGYHDVFKMLGMFKRR